MRHPLDPGYRVTNSFSSKHPGTDYAPPKAGQTGVPCYAPETSTVMASSKGTVEGNYVILQGLVSGKFYYFGHFAERKVAAGRGIQEGAVIGILGKTGQASGIHTHCEVRSARNVPFSGKVDPEKWFKDNVKEEPMFNEGDRKNWLTEAAMPDSGQYRNLVGKVTFKEALETMRRDELFRINPGDVVNLGKALGTNPAKGDKWKDYGYALNQAAKAVPSTPKDEYVPYQLPQLFTKKG